jgi:hypothetical protein
MVWQGFAVTVALALALGIDAVAMQDDGPVHGPLSFSYNKTSWCTVGAPTTQPVYGTFPWRACDGVFNVTGDNYSTPSALVGDTVYSDEHGLRVHVHWKQ